MNRSFQSIAALLVSLSGTMLAVTWIPGETPRATSHGTSSRKRSTAVACGYVTSCQQQRQVGTPSADCGVSELHLPLFRNPQSAIRMSDVGRIDLAMWSSRFIESPALRAVKAAFVSGLAPLWPLSKEGSLAVPADFERRRVEEEYAAAELAAAAAAPGIVAQSWQQVVAWLQNGIAAADSRSWEDRSQLIRDRFVSNYEKTVHDNGWQGVVPPLVAHIRRQHDRLALREALLKEMDRRFLNVPVDREWPLLQRPQYKAPSRKFILAAAEALKSLSQTLNAAAERLEAVSRHDVAELHTPLEKREEKR